jgi:Peptidase A4 family
MNLFSIFVGLILAAQAIADATVGVLHPSFVPAAGATISKGGYTFAGANFKAPAVKMPSGGHSSVQYCASIWIAVGNSKGVDMKVGIMSCIRNRKTSISAFFQSSQDDHWSPAVQAGDNVLISFEPNNATISTNNMKESFAVGAPPWDRIYFAVDNSTSDDPLANFGTVEFEHVNAFTSPTQEVDLQGAMMYDITENGKALAKTSCTNTTVTVKYVG